MIWKPKERKLTAEEAIDLAKVELAPYWFGSKPLLAGVENEGRFTAHPLDKKFASKGWVLLFIDPTTFAGEQAIHRFVEWSRRYSHQGVGFIFVLRFPYPELFKKDSIEDAFIKNFKIECAVTVDMDGALSGAFQARKMPKACLLHQGKVLFNSGEGSWETGLEEEIQKFLRLKDPGLPLFPPIHDPWRYRDVSRLEFGAGKSDLKPVAEIPEILDRDEIIFTGKWERDQKCIMTMDKKAALSFLSPSPHVLLIAKAFNKTVEPGIVAVEVNGVVVFEEYVGEDLKTDEEGRTVARLHKPFLYRILKNLPPKERAITFRFPTAEHLKVALYGLQFGE